MAKLQRRLREPALEFGHSASQRDALKIARHFSAVAAGALNSSPIGTTEKRCEFEHNRSRVLDMSVVPMGLASTV